jgi:isoaspartyl peptidase/L-asparaginase-like protein (Ntn-hydrolase superfamily)
MKVVMAKSAVEFLRSEAGSEQPGNDSTDRAMTAARGALGTLARRTHATAGLILLDKNGNPGWAFNTPRMAFGYVQSDGTLCTAV